MPFPMDEEDAARLIIYSGESFWSLPHDQMTLEQRMGAIMFLENTLSRAIPLIPKTPAMEHLHVLLRELRKTSDLIRSEYDIDRKV